MKESSGEANREPLKPSHERFAQEMAKGKSGTVAAKAAFPNQTTEAAAATASRLLRRPDIRARIQERIEEASGITGLEIIGTLAMQMRGDVLEAFEDSDSPFIKRLREKNLGYLVKAITIKRTIEVSGDVQMPIEITRIEFYSAQAAAQELGRIYGLRQTARENDRDATLRMKVAQALERLAKKHFGGDVGKAKEVWLATHPELSKYMN